MHPAVILTEQHWSALPASARIRACAFTEPSLVFYRPQPGGWKLDGHLDRALAWLLQDSTNDRAAVFLAREWSASDAIERFAKTGKWEGAPEKDFSEALTRGIEPADFETRLVSGYNVARSSWVELLVVTPGETAGSSKAP
jgi:hypothetical protein